MLEVCVIIAAKDAAATIQRSVRSALREPQVAEVVVVDDGSTDATAKKALAADDGTDRLRVLTLDRNRDLPSPEIMPLPIRPRR